MFCFSEQSCNNIVKWPRRLEWSDIDKLTKELAIDQANFGQMLCVQFHTQAAKVAAYEDLWQNRASELAAAGLEVEMMTSRSSSDGFGGYHGCFYRLGHNLAIPRVRESLAIKVKNDFKMVGFF